MIKIHMEFYSLKWTLVYRLARVICKGGQSLMVKLKCFKMHARNVCSEKPHAH